jgi:hypothetical protein
VREKGRGVEREEVKILHCFSSRKVGGKGAHFC